MDTFYMQIILTKNTTLSLENIFTIIFCLGKLSSLLVTFLQYNCVCHFYNVATKSQTSTDMKGFKESITGNIIKNIFERVPRL